MGTSLFRQEVLEQQAGRFAGAIVLIRPVPMRAAAGAAAVLAAAVLAFLVGGHYTRSVTVSGQLVPVAGSTRSTSPQFGRVVAVHVREGDVVAAGQLMIEISSERTTREGGVETRSKDALLAQRDLVAAESQTQLQQLEQRRRELQVRATLFRDEASSLAQEYGLQRKRLALAEDALRRTRSLQEQGYVSAAQVAQAEGEHLEHQARLQGMERSRLAALREQGQVESELAQLGKQADIVQLQGMRSQATFEQGLAEQQARMNVRILAQTPGKLTALAIHTGDTVDAGAVLATIVPQDGAFEALLATPSESIGFAAAEQPVRMRVAAYPYQKFGYLTGKVRMVEHGPITEAQAGNKNGSEPYYRIAVKLDRQSIYADGKERPFKPGMRLEAVIKQERRRLIQWLFDPVRSAIKTSIN